MLNIKHVKLLPIHILKINDKALTDKRSFKMSTIKDVARVSKTSVGTVSRYLNGYPIKDSNRERVESAIEELDFTINLIARGLKTNRTNTVGILIPRLSNIFSTHIIEGMEQTFDEHGYSILVCDSRNDVVKEKEKLRFLKDKLVDGIIMMPVEDTGEHIKQIQEGGLPIVLVDRLVKDIRCDGVVSDNVNGAYQAIENIIIRGHKRIGIIAGPQNIYTARERIEGYYRALRDYNVEVDENLIIYSDYTQAGGTKAIERLLKLSIPPTSIFAANYETTIGVIKAMIDKGIMIGQDISIFGYDQIELSQVITPPLSLVIQPMDEIGRKAAELLIKRMRGDYTGFPMICRLKTEIVVTNSVKKLV